MRDAKTASSRSYAALIDVERTFDQIMLECSYLFIQLPTRNQSSSFAYSQPVTQLLKRNQCGLCGAFYIAGLFS